jgi:hypothetical protein
VDEAARLEHHHRAGRQHRDAEQRRGTEPERQQPARREDEHGDAVDEPFGEDDRRGPRVGCRDRSGQLTQPVALGQLTGLAWRQTHSETRQKDEAAVAQPHAADIQPAQVPGPAHEPQRVVPDGQAEDGHDQPRRKARQRRQHGRRIAPRDDHGADPDGEQQRDETTADQPSRPVTARLAGVARLARSGPWRRARTITGLGALPSPWRAQASEIVSSTARGRLASPTSHG